MKVGTKSVLWGVHAFWWHPLSVALAWRSIYKRWPTLPAWVAIFTHDLGYIGCKSMDGFDGLRHPARIAPFATGVCRVLVSIKLFFNFSLCPQEKERLVHRASEQTKRLVLTHSRAYVIRFLSCDPGVLCWPDKLSIYFDPKWFYLLRARLSGEVYEYVRNAPGNMTPGDWYDYYKKRTLAKAKRELDKVPRCK